MYSIKEFFNSRAAVWDKTALIQDEETVRVLLKLSDIRPDSVILDVGCGTGMLEPYLLDYAPERIYAIDFAQEMIAQAKLKLEHPCVEFICADFYDFGRVRCDNCFFVSVLPHLPDQERAVRHAASLLKPGGRLTVFNVQGKYCGHSTDILNPLLPAQSLIDIMRPYYRLDAIVDNRSMFLISGTRLGQ